VAEVMGTDLFTLTPDTVVASALRLATTKHIHHFLVIEEGNLTGIVCDEDLRQARQTTMVGDCMTSPVLCIGPETTLADAVNIMDENAVGCLPVITGAFLVGMITRDKLSGIAAVEPEEAPPVEDVEKKAPVACAACGSDRNVQSFMRAGMIPLCTDCVGIVPSTGTSRGN
jgi:CBS domain-containing protein